MLRIFGISCRNVLLVVAVALAAASPALAGGHGIALAMGLNDPRCEFDVIDGTMTVRHNDGFGDSTRVVEAFATVDAAEGPVRVPAEGHLEIVAVAGNTTAEVGGALPVILGPAGSILSGLPGANQDGAVTFRVTGYVIREDDPDRLRVFGSVMWQDLCDDPGTTGCDTGVLESIAAANTDVYRPRITLERAASVAQVCDGFPTEVTYTYTLGNPGNVALVPDLVDDAPCGLPMLVGGDDNGNFMIDPADPNTGDPAEVWVYECTATIAQETTSNAVVTGTSDLLDCGATAEASLTIPAIACGACCFDADPCEIIPESECIARGGEFGGAGVDCASGVCDGKAACCLADGSCLVVTETECLQLKGVHLPDDPTCATADCPRPPGACCLEGICTIETQADCGLIGGLYQGDGVACVDVECPPVKGACCFNDGSCAVQTREDCEDAGGIYTLDGSNCSPNPCPAAMGACCLEGICLIRPQAVCAAIGGLYQGNGVPCEDVECPPVKGACCSDDGTCAVMTEDECSDASGVYTEDGTVCVAGLCDQPVGACCFDDGSCVILTRDDCEEAAGHWQGAETTCEPGLCIQPEGACCLASGQCLLITRDDCQAQGGAYHGNGVECAPGLCPQPKGACCLEDGTCESVTEADCGTLGGTYRGDATICAPGLCLPPEGACCFDGGACATRTRDACADQGGHYQGDGTACVDGLCPPITGACCFDGDVCAVMTATDCADLGGTYQGDDTVCVIELCVEVGACCFANDCVGDLTPLECVGGGGRFQGVGTTCGEIECGRGACCFDGGGCVEHVAPSACAGSGGAYLGDDSLCTPAAPGDPGLYRLFNHPDADEAPPGYALRLDELFDVTGGQDVFTFDFDGPGSAMFLEVEGASIRIHGTAFGGLDVDGAYDPDWVSFVEIDITYAEFGFAPGDDDIEVTTPGGTNTGSITWLRSGDVIGLRDLSQPPGFTFRLGDGDDDEGHRGFEGLSGWGRLEYAGGTFDGSQEWLFIALGICAEPPMGACCFDDGSCTMTTERDCVDDMGLFAGATVSCGEAGCDLGACCIPDSDCLIARGGDCIFGSVADCIAMEGTFQGSRTTCEDESCFEETGACCFSDGCEVMSAFCCLQGNGLFLGDGTDCANDECFECDGNIVGMTMIWDGAQPVRVRAYDGFTGSPLLADIDNIEVGDRVTVGPLQGPLDSFWEIFEAGTSNLLGLSKFNRSCADPDMNGPEDCGKRQGNGRTDTGGLINDWLLEGLVDEGGTELNCSGATCVEDVDGNGVIGFGDILVVLGAWETDGPGDVDGDGTVGFGDVLRILAMWGPC